MRTEKNRKKGFSLVECMISVLILTTLTTLVMYCMRGYIRHQSQRDEQIKALAGNISTFEDVSSNVTTLEELYMVLENNENITAYNTVVENSGQSGKCELLKDDDGNMSIKYDTLFEMSDQAIVEGGIVNPTTFRLSVNGSGDVPNSKLDGILTVSTKGSVGLAVTSEQFDEMGMILDGNLVASSPAFDSEVCVVPQYVDDVLVSGVATGGFSGTNILAAYLPKMTVRLSLNAFNGCYNLTTFKYEAEQLDVYDSVFFDCVSLRNIDISRMNFMGFDIFDSSSINRVDINENITELPSANFASCVHLEKVNLDNIQSIGSGCFNGCDRLRDIVFSTELNKIAGNAFKDCLSVTELTFPKSVTEIGNEAFGGCTSLRSVFFESGSNTLTIPSNIFNNTPNLTQIVLPQKVKLSSNAFYGAGNGTISTIYYDGLMSEWEAIEKAADWNLYTTAAGIKKYFIRHIQCLDGIVDVTIPESANNVWIVF